ncbi:MULTISPECIES: hypothetical protein [unclassified Devosia]|uniref:hypothetical protein n=1 Tax=unclassified Devosia TaxID=196773 RepID=UPI001553822D|nr:MULTISPECIES: hypothetical protein [unclassified Devosia]
MSSSKVTTGANDRPKDETIAQTGAGLPDDTSLPVDVSDEDVERACQKLTEGTPFALGGQKTRGA